jgi:glycosyltransferase involved in cell wall biosynthesis
MCSAVATCDPAPARAPSAPPIASIVIPAHDEAGVIGRCLDALFSGIEPHQLDVVVVCNGCSDATAAVARASAHPVRVLELEQPSKAAALRAGDVAARGFPRLYVDADVVLPGASAVAVARRLVDGAIAARPPLAYETSRSSPPVRSYYRARARMPAVMRSLWGAGVYGLSADGRSRFGPFPDIGADDLWIDRLFGPGEVEIVDDCEPVVVAVPRRARDLLHVLRRTYRGKAETAPAVGADDRARATTSSALGDLRRLASSGPLAAVDAAVYIAFAIAGRAAIAAAARRRGGRAGWERDESSRALA